ncbi:hypothetical protein CMI41_01210 [Candidatus Pacearchaeota archaeon]|nr:hypothetical protein [Candidatus Pacearchaeota archaeon]|tara:strand:- start:12140 stop:12352 length:213 start_codon:yes stop_codon:yes gene_type:complete
MTDPNLEKIIEANIKDIENDELGLTLAQASSYLDYIYRYERRDRRKIELERFTEKIKNLANFFKNKNRGN